MILVNYHTHTKNYFSSYSFYNHQTTHDYACDSCPFLQISHLCSCCNHLEKLWNSGCYCCYYFCCCCSLVVTPHYCTYCNSRFPPMYLANTNNLKITFLFSKRKFERNIPLPLHSCACLLNLFFQKAVNFNKTVKIFQSILETHSSSTQLFLKTVSTRWYFNARCENIVFLY